MNSLLQCLKNLYSLTSFILTNKFTQGKLIIEYQQLLFNLISTKNEIVDASEYLKALGKIDSCFDTYEQRDSSKLFLTHIKSLIEDSKLFNSGTEIDPNIEKNEPKLAKRYKKAKERSPSKIYDFFFGFLKNINFCKQCGRQDINYQPFSLIDLELENEEGRIKKLEKLIENFEDEKITDFACSCGAKIYEKTFLGRIPPILVFKFHRSVDGRHINHKIDYPEKLYMRNYSDGFLKEKDNNDKNNPNFKYNLTGVMLHIGNAISGHKTAYSKNFLDNNNWYYFNDSSKKKESKRNVLNDPAAFMLFYISDSYKITPDRIKKIKELAEKK